MTDPRMELSGRCSMKRPSKAMTNASTTLTTLSGGPAPERKPKPRRQMMIRALLTMLCRGLRMLDVGREAVWRHVAAEEADASRTFGVANTIYPAGAETASLIAWRAMCAAAQDPEAERP